MEILNLVQGTPEWHAERAQNFTASEAPAMKGLNPNKTRNQLLAEKKTGVAKEVSDYTQEVVFANGHKVEALARPMAEKIIDDELFPCTGKDIVDGLPMLASFDGLTMDHNIIWECKQWNKEKAQMVSEGEMPEADEWQVVQQLVLSRAKKCLYMVTDGTPANTEYLWYQLIPVDEKTLIAGWKQFEQDLETFEPPQVAVVHEIAPREELPALAVIVKGTITQSNLTVYKSTALEIIEGINLKLESDHDFATAEQDIKFLSNAEKELANAKKQILGQTADIDQAFKTIDHLTKSMSIKRLALDKLVKNQKTVIKENIVSGARDDLSAYIVNLYKDSNVPSNIQLGITGNFAGAIKGKRNIDSMQNAVDTELAERKIAAFELADLVKTNYSILNDRAADHLFLFNDLPNIIEKSSDDFLLVVNSRLDEHRKAEADKLEVLRQQAVDEAQKIVDDKKAADEETAESLRSQDVNENAVEQVSEVIEVIAEAVQGDVEDIKPGKVIPVNTKAEQLVEPATAEQMLAVLANHYGLTHDTMIDWLRKADFDLLLTKRKPTAKQVKK